MSQPVHRGEYPATWPMIARRVKDAAFWRCVRCDRDHDPASGYTLTVHHFDGDKSNCALWNLMALCQRCHLSVQARVDPEQPLMFEPSAWALPHIAGFYAAGRGVPGPLFDVDAWMKRYGQECNRTWPAWAPQCGREVARG